MRIGGSDSVDYVVRDDPNDFLQNPDTPVANDDFCNVHLS